MLIIGLTGGIATGKTTVAEMLRQLGAYVIDADAVVRELEEPGQPVWQSIVDAFGPAVLDQSGRLNRSHLADIIFSDPEARRRLNAITHPAAVARMFTLAEEARERGAQAVVLDVPLLFEAGMEKAVDQIWVVKTDQKTQLSRLMERQHLTMDQAMARILSQMPLDQKVAQADVVIDNNGSLAETKRQVEQAWLRVAAMPPG